MTNPAANDAIASTPHLSPAAEARELVRRGLKCALGTLASQTGTLSQGSAPSSQPNTPYVSLVTVASAHNGAPVVLISRLALHTQNLLINPVSSLLFDGTSSTGNPLAGGRVSLMGRFSPTQNPDDHRRFLTRHPESRMYADFPDFGFFKLDVERAHFIGGFGRIVDLKPDDLLLDLTGADQLIAAEQDIVNHMNNDHADALELCATRLAGCRPGTWRITGLDPEGFDLTGDGVAARVLFGAKVMSPNSARLELVRLSRVARELPAAS